ncbi:hypothetical protein SLEP1_g7104 [Rubroshorea leprosula]|uniref:Uncharacterized protein n=1 Tax=Rubroshorea leprosula TaxID=152421 RepID=A0AAV5I5L0_9ROSI|nr:hypothetical protein SLEP1_g7104 [Rubroshorea leprosula]
MVGPPKRHFLFLFILSLCVLLLYSYHHSSLLSPISSETTTQFPHHVSTTSDSFTLTIKVLTFNRLHALSRCLRSLARAQYLPGNPVHLHVFIDHFVPSNDSNMDQKLRESHKILGFVDGFEWKWGQKMVHYRTTNAGLQAQWLEAWWPTSDNEFAFVVEDDLELSPLYYKFLRSLILNYYNNASNSSPHIYGATLQRPRFVPGKHGNKLQLDGGTQLFLYQLVGTWGQLLFPKPWKEFRLWYDQHKAKGIKPLLEGMVTTGWYKRMGERIWTPWFIKFIHSRGYFNIYTNFEHERALSVSHRDAGVNYGKTAGPDSQLLDENSLLSNLINMQPLSKMKWYDFCFREVLPGRVVMNLDDLGAVLHSVQREQTILLVSLFGASEMITRNLLCHFERLNIQNYILMGPRSDFLFDLARRGHPVLDADQFVTTFGVYRSLGFQESNAMLIEDVLVKAYAIKKSLECSYNTWVIDGNMLFLNTNLFLESIDSAYDFYTGESLELYYVKSSPSAHKIWTDTFLNDVPALVNKVLHSKESKSFAYMMTTLLEHKGFRVKRLNEKSFGMKIGDQDFNQSSLDVSKRLVYWPKDLSMDVIHKQLQGSSLWNIDEDSSCTAVVCHKS